MRPSLLAQYSPPPVSLSTQWVVLNQASAGQCRRGLDLGLVTSTRGNRGEILVNTVPPGGVFFEEASSRCHSDI